MPLFTEDELRLRYHRELRTRYFSNSRTLNENVQRIQDSRNTFDIFLSHSSSDMEIVLGLSFILKDLGYSVYVDWQDSALDKNKVTPETAAILRNRMSCCKALLYAFSEGASNSKWMPWELGYFDGLKDNMVAVLPISKVTTKTYHGSEYVGLYYHIRITEGINEIKRLWVYNKENYVSFSGWLTHNQKP